MIEMDEFEERLHKLNFYLSRNIYYHMRRQAFFMRWSRFTSFVGVMFGSAAAAALLSPLPTTVAAVLAIVVAGVSAFDLVVGTGQHASLHNDLRKRYLDLTSEITTVKPANLDAIGQVFARIKRIELDEPPTMPALEILAYEDTVRSIYNGDDAPKHLTKLSFFKRLTAQWFYWDTSKA